MTNFSAKSSGGYTLIEILMAVTLSLILMLAVVQIFAMVGDYVTNSQAVMELDQNIRNAQMTLQLDLARATAKMTPPLDPAAAMGYFIYNESDEKCPVTDLTLTNVIDSNLAGDSDSLQFTIHDMNSPLLSYSNDSAAGAKQSFDAEVRWFMNGNNLYRNVRLLTGEEDSNLFSAAKNPTQIPQNEETPILQNVIKFDVQIWDSEHGEFIDGKDETRLSKPGYDTGNRFEESTLSDSSQVVGYYTPKARSVAPLKGVRIKVRVVEPTTGMVRDFTVEQDYTGN